MATFHPFPRLPAELRIQIWEMTVEPRVVDVRLEADWARPKVRGKYPVRQVQHAELRAKAP
jgi:hypothetical protein